MGARANLASCFACHARDGSLLSARVDARTVCTRPSCLDRARLEGTSTMRTWTGWIWNRTWCSRGSDGVGNDRRCRNVDGTAMSGFCATNGDAESIQACEWTLNESQPPSDANPKKGPAKFRIVF
mmetsp:Transcript_2253/g.14955  ORF Transcript_2253/g.14955 Transcript_2253/m.14955 type:complete len:125 (+) Transcript_2253:308-682(+)